MNRTTRLLCAAATLIFGVLSIVRGYRGLFGSPFKPEAPSATGTLPSAIDNSRPLAEQLREFNGEQIPRGGESPR